MKKTICVLLCILALLSLSACGNKVETEPEEGGNMQIPNPFVDCASLDEAAGLAGFDIAVPGKFDGYPNVVYQAIKDELIQVLYFDGDPEAETSSMVMVRKGTGEGDISGDYNEYPEDETVKMHGVDVTLKGENGLVFCATWTWNGYAFAINADRGLSREAIGSAVGEMVTVVG